jgi:predicted extracellular nuclease
MKRATASIFTAAILTLGAAAQTTPASTNTAGSNSPAQVNPAPANSSLRILTPVANQKLTTNAINVRWQLLNQGLAAAGAPNYQVQLDGADPTTTSSTEQSFAGLAPGQHTVVIRLVDANGTPIAGAASQVQFVVMQEQNTPAAAPKTQSKKIGKATSLFNAAFFQHSGQQPASSSEPIEESVPASAGALPLLSVVGFGALIGGVISARKTRR